MSMSKVPRKIGGKQKPYGGTARYIIYVSVALFGVVCSILLLFALFALGVLILLGCALVFSSFHSKSRKGQFLMNVGKIFFWSAVVSIIVLFILFWLAMLGISGS